jgi:hypothetical protein
MDPIVILRNGWRITWRTGRLWVLSLLTIIVTIPAFGISGAMGALSALLVLPPVGSSAFTLPDQIQNLSPMLWLWITLAVIAGLVFFLFWSWGFQAAAMRMAAAAADSQKLSLPEALRLGRQRWISYGKLSLSFGLLIEVLTVLPPFGIVALAQHTEWGAGLLNAAEVFLAPLSSMLGIAALLVSMAIALEDLRPRQAFRRAWSVFRFGWWGFVLVLLANVLISFVAAIVAAPIFILVGLLVAVAMYLSTPLALAVAICAIVMGVMAGVGIIAFALVFSTVLYTLTYRTASTLISLETIAQSGS